jgi:glycosyltransferase involved in cell wall biosynthesis
VAKVLWLGDAGSHTGFARVTHSIGERLVEDYGHDVHVLGYNYRGDSWPSRRDPDRQTPLKLYRPNAIKGDDIFGLSRHIELLAKIEPDVVVMLHDANMILYQLFENAWDKDQILARYRPLITYIPVDGYNRPPAWNILTTISNAVAMSRFGKDAMPGSKLVYHGVDHDLFRPVSRETPLTISSGAVVRSQGDCKEAFGYPRDCFLIVRSDKNSGRKDFAATIKAAWPVMKRHSDVRVHLHTTGGRSQDDALVINDMLTREPTVHDRFSLPNLHNSFIGWPEEDLIALFNAADLFVTTSRGEGFGLNIAEAMACGTPVIAQNVSAIPEVVGPGGILLEPQRQITVPNGSDLYLPDIDAFSDAIERLYGSRGARRDLGRQAREHIVASFSWDFATAKFDEFIRALAATPEVAVAAS